MLEWLYEGGARFKKLGVHAQSTNERCVMSTAKIEVPLMLTCRRRKLCYSYLFDE